MVIKVLNYKVIVHRARDVGGYWAEVPSIPGCFTQGKNMKELREMVKEAIELCLECS
jgi:predicted RNase H-like HicB family nuclease